MAKHDDLKLTDETINAVDQMTYPELWAQIEMRRIVGAKNITPQEQYFFRRMAELQSNVEAERHRELVEARKRANRISIFAICVSVVALVIAIDWSGLLEKIGGVL